MKKYRFIMLFFFQWAIAIGQTNDSFSDGDFTSDPSWSGDISHFTINSSHQLQLNNSVAGTSYLSTAFPATSIDDFHWQIYVKQTFSPSGSNYGRIYLTSDASDLSKALNGYYLQFGEGGSNDAIELFRQTGTTSYSVCRSSHAGIASSFAVRVKVNRDAVGLWKISADYTGESNFVEEASGTDDTYQSSSYFGVLCTYTVSNSTKFYFDDVVAGPEIVGNPPPPVAQPVAKDVIFTEIMADYSPSIGLPEAEYIEIYNRSQNNLDVSGWKLSDGSTIAVLPSQIIGPNEYRIVTSLTSAQDFAAYPHVIALSPFPSLNNDGDAITLRSSNGLLIDSVNYTIAFYHDVDKEDGGWSMELIDPANVCAQLQNWTASENAAGGTPGQQNSVFTDKPDLTGPRLVTAIPQSASLILLQFDESLEKTIPSQASFEFIPSVIIGDVRFTDASLQELSMTPTEPLPASTLYTVHLHSIYDCSGNIIQEGYDHCEFALPELADSLDVVINEVLFNPVPNGVDFVELYNRSGKFISLAGWKLGSLDGTTVKEIHELSSSIPWITPGSFIACSENSTALKNNFPHGDETRMVQTALPSLPDDEGSIALLDNNGRLVDCFFYNKNFHSDWVRDDEGVSLERISYNRPTNDRQNWKSASSQSGFGTPGMVNSNARPDHALSKGSVVVEPEIFEPNSGSFDFAKINYAFEQAGYMANIKVIDQEGHLIKTIASNETLGFEGFFKWEGDRDDGARARIGYYVVWVEVFDTSGFVKTFRKRAVIATR